MSHTLPGEAMPANALTAGLQPLLHNLSTCLAAPTVVLSAADGQIRPNGAQGVFSADVRVLSRAELTVDGRAAEQISSAMLDAGSAEFVSVIRWLGDPIPDPTVWLRRSRIAAPDGMTESLTLVNVSETLVTAVLGVQLAADLIDMEDVKAGGAAAARRPEPTTDGVDFAGGAVRVQVRAPEAVVSASATAATIQWTVSVPARAEQRVHWSVRVADTGAAVIAADPAGAFTAPTVEADDRRLAPFVARSVADLRALRMATPSRPQDAFLAAGSPWYLTLFGRDSLWAARMLLPLGTDLAGGTLRTLAFRQGRGENPDTAEEPGKILHEIRRQEWDPPAAGNDRFLPPVYYGTVDATPLWVCLLADAWRWGMPESEVRELLPVAERALDWMSTDGDSDGDGFLEYVDDSGRGLTNQGWKDSGDSVRFADGRIAAGPVALAEVQGYAYQAALDGADLLDAFGRPGADRWRGYAADLAERFRARFWCRDDLGAYPALALDGDKNRVDAPASNMGHLLATGILSGDEAAAVADRLVHPSMSSGFGLRTMASSTGGYSPLSYHCGSVWAHDTAIAIHGLLRAGFPAHATELASGLLAAGAAFDSRLPELYGGFSATDSPVPVPYPASCRPQAWAAASAIVLLQSLLGLEADVPGGTIRVRPAAGLGALRVTGLQVGGMSLGLAVGSDGTVTHIGYTGPLRVER